MTILSNSPKFLLFQGGDYLFIKVNSSCGENEAPQNGTGPTAATIPQQVMYQTYNQTCL